MYFRQSPPTPYAIAIMSDYLAKETPDPTTARLVEEAEESSEEQGKEKSTDLSKDPKRSTKKASDVLGEEPSKQRVITYSELQEEKKRTKPFKAKGGLGELQQEV